MRRVLHGARAPTRCPRARTLTLPAAVLERMSPRARALTLPAAALERMSPRALARTLAADMTEQLAGEGDAAISYTSVKPNDVADSDLREYNALSPDDQNKVGLPKNDAQIIDIFAEREGHLADTPANRKLLVDLANDKSKYVGKDRYGNAWNISTIADGSQIWARYQNGVLNEGGKNSTPRAWDRDRLEPQSSQEEEQMNESI